MAEWEVIKASSSTEWGKWGLPKTLKMTQSAANDPLALPLAQRTSAWLATSLGETSYHGAQKTAICSPSSPLPASLTLVTDDVQLSWALSEILCSVGARPGNLLWES